LFIKNYLFSALRYKNNVFSVQDADFTAKKQERMLGKNG